MENENKNSLNNGKMNPSEYFIELTKEFPILKTEIDLEDSDNYHFRMEIFSNYNIEQIKAKNYKELKRCFDFQESRIEKLNSSLYNALNVSYCESLLLGKCANEMTEMFKLMPQKLKKVYMEYEEYYTTLGQVE
ncbi:MAG: hypothetical protein JEZ01_12155 [Labilibaculum sp.]|nr:hypothetical protein [Labilibaculum sp.]MBI9058507.1 hypothetical protein [Labilibaculum sp.]